MIGDPLSFWVVLVPEAKDGFTVSLDPERHHLDRRAAKLATEMGAVGEPEDLLTTGKVAEWLGVSHQWLEIARSKGRIYGPPFVKITPNMVRCRRRDDDPLPRGVDRRARREGGAAMMRATRQAEKRERNRLRDQSRSIVMATSQTPPTP